LYGIKADRGFLALIAESGMGKTTLLYRLMEELHDSARTVFLFQTNVILVSFSATSSVSLASRPAGMGLAAMHKKLKPHSV